MSESSATMVGDLLTLSETAAHLGTSPNRVRQLVREHFLAGVRSAAGQELRIPAAFLMSGAVVKGLPGTLTLLADHGFSDTEAIEWLFTPDDSLPGRPIDALREDRGKEVRRRAQVID